jgi:glucose/arabinose dehydrogenase
MRTSIWNLGGLGIAGLVLAASLNVSVAGPCEAAPQQLRTELYLTGLSAPLGFAQDPADPTVQYVVEQGGTIRVVTNGVLQSAPFLDLSGAISSGGEAGLLGLALAPDYAVSHRFYVDFTNPSGHTVVARFTRSAGSPLVADAASRFDLRWPSGDRFIVQPYPNHNGGHLAFGPDGYLYVGMGDGGAGNDPEHRAQNPASLLGKMLRLDVNVPDSDANGYRVPANNPFVAGVPVGVLGEIWAFGLRNPWKFSFDDPALGGTGALIIGDVGQGTWEEIDYEPAGTGGRNYGWRNREGAHANISDPPPAYLPLRDPVFEVPHPEAASITGGIVYRGRALDPHFRGRYFFGDFITGRVWSLSLSLDGDGEATVVDRVDHTAQLAADNPPGNIAAFGQDADGELYLISYSAGRVLKIAAVPTPPPASFVGPTQGGGWSGELRGSTFTYNGVAYAAVSGVVTFPDCSTYWVAPNGLLFRGAPAAGNCTPGGTSTLPPAPPPTSPPSSFVGPTQGGGWSGELRGGTFTYNGVAHAVVNGVVTFPDCSTYWVAPNGLLFRGAPAASNCTPGGTSTPPPAPPPVPPASSFLGPAQGGGWSGALRGTTLTYNGVAYAVVNAVVTFPDCSTYLVAPNGLLFKGAPPATGCTPAGSLP